MGFFSHKAENVDQIDVKTIDRGRPHPYVMHTDKANRDHSSCVVCGQDPNDVLHIPASEYHPVVAIKSEQASEPAEVEIRWS